MLGIGTGGAMHGTEAWEAVGVPYAERGRRTDEALALLPGLIRGETVELPVGRVDHALPGQRCAADPHRRQLACRAAPRAPPRRGLASRHGHAPEIADGARRLPEAAQIAAGGIALLGADATDPRIDQFVASLIDGLGTPPEDAVDLPITGTPAQAAERFGAYADAGATWLVLGTIGDDWRAQWKLIAQAATLLD